MDLNNDKLSETSTTNKCTICQRSYVHKRTLYSHLRYDHNIEPLPRLRNFICNYCDKAYSSEIGLKKHVKSLHKPATCKDSSRELRIVCPNKSCMQKFTHFKHLRAHVTEQHSVELKVETVDFNDWHAFECWKNQVQQCTMSYYTLDTSGKKLSQGFEKKYFNCHHSYKHKPRGHNILRKSTSFKLGAACPSRMEVTIKPCSVQVKFWQSHYGHDPLTIKQQDFKDIYRSHKSSLTIKPEMIETVEPYFEWLVWSENVAQRYNVKLVQQTCQDDCFKCLSCSICIHTFNCTCVEAVTKQAICRHIHAVAREFPVQTIASSEIRDLPEETSEEENVHEVYSIYSVEIAQKIEQILGLCSEVELSEDNFLQVQGHLNEVIKVFQAGQSNGENEGQIVGEVLQDDGICELDIHSGFDHSYI